jgi:hypothetical protein
MMEELHTDSIDGGHEASYGARSRARERAYSNIIAFPGGLRVDLKRVLRLLMQATQG